MKLTARHVDGAERAEAQGRRHVKIVYEGHRCGPYFWIGRGCMRCEALFDEFGGAQVRVTIETIDESASPGSTEEIDREVVAWRRHGHE